jgi:hypothetical protein
VLNQICRKDWTRGNLKKIAFARKAAASHNHSATSDSKQENLTAACRMGPHLLELDNGTTRVSK